MNKKLIKTIASITCGLGIVGSIPFASTSCGCSSEKINSLTQSVYDIDQTTYELKGFKDDFLNNPDSEIYQDNFKDCDTMIIPAKVTSIAINAFFTYNYQTQRVETTIPEFITKLTFAKNSKCSLIGAGSFSNCSSLTSITFPSSLTYI
ncbi:MAG: leucine-rich repeat domain-containing protein [Mycoplasmoidaceae bacterium]|nr:leucine-rich repeat domain-containing protein [Mycoplasmoidaceae bacterium]